MQRNKVKHLKIAWHYLKEFRWLLALCLVLVLCASVFEGLSVALVVPLLEEMSSGDTATGISRFTRGFFTAFGLEQSFVNLLLLFSVLTLAKFGLTEWARYENRVLSASLRYRMRGKIFDNLMVLPLQFYYRRRIGDIIVSTDTSTTESAALVENAIRLVNAAMFAAVYVAIAVLLSVWMTVIALVFTLISYYFVYPRFSISFTQGEEAKDIFNATQGSMRHLASVRLQ